MKIVKTFALLILVTSLISCNNQGVSQKSLETEIDSVSYALGLNMATQLKSNFKEVKKDLFVQGYINGMDSVNLLINEKDVLAVLNAFFQKKQKATSTKEAEEKFAVIKKEGEAFLLKNKTKKGVKTTASGLQYSVLKEGKGDSPIETSQVKVHYHGTLLDGTVFDSSVDKKTPYVTYVNRVIKGWVEGLQLMKVGAKYTFYVPQELAYGATPNPRGAIKPFMPLVFEVELLEILKK
ncbi:MAG: FKBP-type peptidyl-prolyl cis-trans isomerase [Polaribacter sp.]|jgi:FKBP-type peptidyl-prolyl cis-trans isomerase